MGLGIHGEPGTKTISKYIINCIVDLFENSFNNIREPVARLVKEMMNLILDGSPERRLNVRPYRCRADQDFHQLYES